MRQIALLPSGCLLGSQNTILYYCDDYILYASSLAVYVLNPKTFQVEKILTNTQKAITSISVSPLSKDILAVSTSDGAVTTWNISDEQIISRANLNQSVSVAFDPFNQNICAIISLVNVRLLLWDIVKASNGLTEVFTVRSDTLKPVVVRWSVSVPGILAIGCNAGTTFLFNTKDKTHKVLQTADKKADVVDIQWDRLSTSYLLIAYSNHLILWDSVTLEILMSFEKQPLGISVVSWLDWTAGNFISTNGRNSHVKIWNASQKTSLRSIKIPYNSAITAITFNANNQKALIGFHDGTVAVYDIDRNRFDYKSQPGHTETIFSCKISPTSPDKFATASYDGTIKVWDLNHLSVTKTLYGNGEFVYCVDWSLTGRIIAGSFYSGLIMFWNPTTGRELLRLPQAHTKACYFLEWNHFHESILLSTSADNTVLVYDIHIDHLIDSEIQNIPLGSNHHVRGKSENGNNSLTTNSMNRNNIDQYAQVKYKFVHPAPVYGCSWNAFKPTVFCTAAHDGIVRVFNFAAKTLLARTLVGHSARAFSCLWSPLVPGLLASGSDDYSIMIWDVDVENFPESAVVTSPDGPGVFGDKVLSIGDLGRTPSMSMNIANAGYAKAMTLSALRVLQGHKSYVRALSWNYENKHLLFSGSWDSTIRIWNVITGSCLVEMNDHVADVYSLVSHPLRPFTYLSCSRDTTVRVWEVERIFRKMRYSALWEEGFQGVLNVEYSPEIDSPDLPQFLKSTLIHSHEGKSSSDFDGGRNSGGAKADLISLEETMKEFAKTPAPTIAAAGTLGLEGKRSQSLQEDIEGMQKRGNHYINSSEGKDSLELDVGRHSKSHRAKSVEELIFKACSYYQIFSFFTNGCGAMDLFEVALETLIPHLSDQPSRKGSNVQNNYKREIETMVTNLIRSKELRKVFAEQEIIPMAYSELNQQQMKKDMNVTTSSTITAKKDIENDLAYEQMIIFQHLKLQEYEKAIQLLLKNQQWDLAISIAPMVSMDYWKKLVADYGTFLLTSNNPTNSITSSTSTSTVMNLKSQRPPLGRAASAPNAGGNAGLSIFSSDERCIPYLLVSGNYDAAIQYYLAQQDYASAKLITQVMATKSNRTSGNENHQMLKEMTTKLIVNQYLSQGELILAAAELLSNQEADLAIELLFKAGEIDLAYCLSQCFSVNTSASLVATYDFYVENGESKSGNSRSVPPHLSPRGITKSILYPPATTLTSSSSNAVISSVLYLSKVDRNDCLLISWADQCAAYNAMDLAITMLQQQLSTVDLQEIEIALLLAKHSNETRCRKSIQQFNLKPLTAWSQLAKEQESIGSDEDAILYYLLARQYHKATQLAIPIMKKYLREPWEFFQLSTRLKPGALIKLYHLIKYIRVKEITDESLKFTFLSLLLWYSAHESWLLGLFENASAMFSVLLSNLHQNDASKGVNTGISREDVLFQLLFSYLYNQRLEEVTRLLKQLIEEMTQIRNQEMKDSLQRMLGFLTAENQKGCQYWTQFAVTFSSASSLSINNNNNGGGKLSNEGEELVHLIIREIQSMASALSLPSIFHVNPRQSSNNHTPRSPRSTPMHFSSDYDFLQRMVSIPQPVVLGSSLPVANQKIKQYRSYLTLKRIQGSAIPLDGTGNSFISSNEAVQWRLVNPYSPLLNGEFLFF